MATQETIHPPFVWERLLAVALWLLIGSEPWLPRFLPSAVGVQFTNMLLIAIPLAGLLLFFILRKRCPFGAKHYLWVACWWLFLPVFNGLVTVGALIGGVPKERLPDLIQETFPRLVLTPGLFSLTWRAMAPSMKIVIAFLLAGIVLHTLVPLLAAIAASVGKPSVRVAPAKKKRSSVPVRS